MIEKEFTENKESPTNFTPSLGRLVKFLDGTIRNMNRAERRKHKLYNWKFKKKE